MYNVDQCINVGHQCWASRGVISSWVTFDSSNLSALSLVRHKGDDLLSTCRYHDYSALQSQNVLHFPYFIHAPNCHVLCCRNTAVHSQTHMGWASSAMRHTNHQSHFHGLQILTSKDDPRSERIKYL